MCASITLDIEEAGANPIQRFVFPFASVRLNENVGRGVARVREYGAHKVKLRNARKRLLGDEEAIIEVRVAARNVCVCYHALGAQSAQRRRHKNQVGVAQYNVAARSQHRRNVRHFQLQ